MITGKNHSIFFNQKQNGELKIPLLYPCPPILVAYWLEDFTQKANSSTCQPHIAKFRLGL